MATCRSAVSSHHEFFVLSHRSAEDGGPRLVYLASPGLSLDYLGTDAVDLGVEGMKRIAPLHVESYRDFVGGHAPVPPLREPRRLDVGHRGVAVRRSAPAGRCPEPGRRRGALRGPPLRVGWPAVCCARDEPEHRLRLHRLPQRGRQACCPASSRWHGPTRCWSSISRARTAPPQSRASAVRASSSTRPSQIVEPVRNEIADRASGTWILVVDPDERVSPGPGRGAAPGLRARGCGRGRRAAHELRLRLSATSPLQRYEPQLRMYRRERRQLAGLPERAS